MSLSGSREKTERSFWKSTENNQEEQKSLKMFPNFRNKTSFKSHHGGRVADRERRTDRDRKYVGHGHMPTQCLWTRSGTQGPHVDYTWWGEVQPLCRNAWQPQSQRCSSLATHETDMEDGRGDPSLTSQGAKNMEHKGANLPRKHGRER